MRRAGRQSNACPATGKVRYRDRQSAIQVIHGAVRNRGAQKVPVRTYFCDACRGWHLTSRK